MKELLKKISHYVPDKLYLKLFYRYAMGENLNLKNPQTFNEKLQWLKLYDRNPLYTKLVDKYEVREYIKEKIGEEYLIPLLGVWDNVEEINFDELPNRFVLKTTHDSGGVVICKDKRTFDVEEAKKFLSEHLQKNFYYVGREWPYKNVKPRIIAEKYLDFDIKDYKFMCFNGKTKCSFVCSERHTDGLKVTFFDIGWNKLPFERVYPCSDDILDKPKTYDKMLELSEILSAHIPFVRVDFYEIGNKIYFGELTFYPGNGLESFNPKEWDYKLGDMINLDLAYSKVGSKNENFNR